jgi:hypothetical protein
VRKGSGVSGEESEAAEILATCRPDCFVAGHYHWPDRRVQPLRTVLGIENKSAISRILRTRHTPKGFASPKNNEQQQNLATVVKLRLSICPVATRETTSLRPESRLLPPGDSEFDDLKFSFGHVWQVFMAAQWQHCKRIPVSRSAL